jgi:hypothetical protein
MKLADLQELVRWMAEQYWQEYIAYLRATDDGMPEYE